MSALAAIVALSGAADAPAPNPHLARAERLYESLQYERALAALGDALVSPGARPEERRDVYIYVGLCRFHLGDERSARVAFREALALDPNAVLPVRVSPKIAAAFAREAEAFAASVTNAPQPAPGPESAPPEPLPAVAPSAPEPPPPMVAPAPPAAATSVEGRARWPAIAAAGAMVALAAGGVVFGLRARDMRQDAEATEFGDDADELLQASKRDAGTANVLYGTAAALGAFAAVWTVITW